MTEAALAVIPKRVRFAIDRRLPASQQVYEHLRAKIVTLDLEPGVALSRADLADAYGLSQTPVRDAFLKLEQEGLVDIYPQSRTVVTRIDVEQARESQFLRLGVELEAVRTLAVDQDKQKLAPTYEILSQQGRALQEDDLSSFSGLDERFHLSLMAAVGHPSLWKLIDRRSGHISRLRNLHLPDPGKATTIIEDHSTILDAVTRSNAVEAEEAVRKHLSGTLGAIDEIRQRYPDFFSPS